MPEKFLDFSPHARAMLIERRIEQRWAERAVQSPDWIVPDTRPDRKRAFKAIPEAGNRVLRVVIAETEGQFRVITVFFDRNAKKP